jgi:hypothetical protein
VDSIARQVVAAGTDSDRVAQAIVDGLAAPDLRVAFVFADWQHDPSVIARVTQRGLAPATVVGGTTIDVIARGAAPRRDGMTARSAAGLGLYGDWVHAGIGVAPELSKSALTRSRDAVHQAALAIGRSTTDLDSSRNVAVTLVDGKCGHEEPFCIGSAAAAPQIRFVGGCSASEPLSPQERAYVWFQGEVMTDAGIVILLESALPFHAVTSAHLVPTSADIKLVVTAASGRRISELDGKPAATRLRQVVKELGEPPDSPLPSLYAFARYVDGVPYVRSFTHFAGTDIHLASAVETGHVLRLMKPGDLIGTTQRDLAVAADRVGGSIAAFLAFSCIGRHWEAASRGIERDLAEAYGAHPTVGFQSFGEQSGMLLVNHTLTGLAIGSKA